MNRDEIKQLLSRAEGWANWTTINGWSAESWARWNRFAGPFDYNFVEWLVPLLEHDKIQFRWRAANCLGHERYANAVKELEECLDDPHWLVRLHSAKALGRIHDNSSINILIAHRKDRCPYVRRRIVSALGCFDHEFSIVPHLIESLLWDDDRKVRNRASEALSRFKGSGTSVLKALMENPDNQNNSYDTAWFVYIAFENQGPISRQQTIAYLTNDNYMIREQALKTLRFRSREDRQTARKMLNDPVERARWAKRMLQKQEPSE